MKFITPTHLKAGVAALATAFITLSTHGAENRSLAKFSIDPDNPTTDQFPAEVDFPGQTIYSFQPRPLSWTNVAGLAFSIFWPSDAPASNAQVLVYIKDWDHAWFQNLIPGYLVPGVTNHFKVDLTPSCTDWRSQEHNGKWNYRALMKPSACGIRVFGDLPYKGTCSLESISALPRQAPSNPPQITNLRVSTNILPAFKRFEVALDLPDRYTDPFDSGQIRLSAEFTTPSGRKLDVDGFYGQDYFRLVAQSGERITPQGAPYWRIRFTPSEKGTYTFSVTATDQLGTSTWGPGTFVATDPEEPGFIRISKIDYRFFEFDDNSSFFPIGHNIRSPFDNRSNTQFPWAQRWPEGSAAYERYFSNLRKSGQNFAEVWSASWSLGLEWAANWHGYHGVGQYNLINAWETDQMFNEAEKNGVYVNFVIHNHGKFSTFSDEEWATNPFSKENGGYLEYPEQYFTEERAKRDFLKLMRYMIARWGSSTHLFAWQLWSELDLTGSRRSEGSWHRQPEVTEWHKLMGFALKEMDPYDHLISTHTCGDYHHQSEATISLPEIDHCPVDAYHGDEDPLYILNLMSATAAYNNPFNKPVIITEFGGTSQAASLEYLDASLHAALWGSTCMPIGGTPLFWWWQIIEEENFYPKYAALANYMKGEDRRSANKLLPAAIILEQENNPSLDFASYCMKNQDRALGWIYFAGTSWLADLPDTASASNLVVELNGMTNSTFDIEFWNTVQGKPISKTTAKSVNGSLRFKAPLFHRDTAFKVKNKASKK